MGRADPFTGYTFLLRLIVYGLIPLFGAWTFLRLKRAAHIFQLESYKPRWYRRWISENRDKARFVRPLRVHKKPLVMTGRVWRMVVTGTILAVLAIYIPSGLVHINLGAPWDLLTAAGTGTLVFLGTPWFLLAGDGAMRPVQAAINAYYLRSARKTLKETGPVVVGVTGSYGKTSTKFAIRALLGSPEVVLATPGSFNTPLGVARTINESLRSRHRFFVVEMGARREGDIAEVCRLVKPQIAVVTAIGSAHLETFGSLEAIERGKYEIVRALGAGGTAVMNVDDLKVRALADQTTSVVVVRYGLETDAEPRVTARDLRLTPTGTALTLVDTDSGDTAPLETRLLGRHAIGHLLAGTAVALVTGRSLADVARAAADLEPVEHRLQVIRGAGGVTVIDDAYNSNPDGAAAALEVLDKMPGRRKVIVTPGMVELGPIQASANLELGRRAAEVADTVIFVARLNREALVAGATEAGAADKVILVDSLAEASEELKGILGTGDVVLFENDLPDQYES